MEYRINYHSVIQESIVDGPGLRFVLFVQGCPHRCPGCHNPDTHDFIPRNLAGVTELFQAYKKNPLLAGITFSGGEPFCQPAPLAALAAQVKDAGGNVITYTGYYFEELQRQAETAPDIRDLLSVTDYLIDGPFILAEKSLDLPFRGSANQRIWDLKRHRIIETFPY